MYRLTFALLLLIFLPACTDHSRLEKFQLQGNTMGTRYHISVIANKRTFQANLVKQQIERRLQAINQQMSTYISESEISRFNRFDKSDWFPVSNQLAYVVNKSLEISRLTNGLFDITAASLVNLWGFGADYQDKIPTARQIAPVLQKTGYQLLDSRLNPPGLRKSHPGLKIDLSAIAKGYAVDQLGALLSKHGFQNYLVEIGGELKSRGNNLNNKPWRIAIENPSALFQVSKHTLELTNQAVATSGDYRNYFEKSGQRYSHTINPLTGKPVTHKLASVTVIGQSALRVDALATALMVMGEAEGKEFVENNNLLVFIIIRDGEDSFHTWDTL